MKPVLLPLIAALALAGCASTPTLYQPASGPQAVGFSEYRIEPGRYRILFRGGSGAPPEQVMDYALLRAADLAIADGYDWFRVAERVVRGAPGGRSSSMSVGVGGGNYGYHSGVGVGLGTTFPLGGGPALEASVEVIMGRGAKPSGPDVYDARGVRRAVGARI